MECERVCINLVLGNKRVGNSSKQIIKVLLKEDSNAFI